MIMSYTCVMATVSFGSGFTHGEDTVVMRKLNNPTVKTVIVSASSENETVVLDVSL